MYAGTIKVAMFLLLSFCYILHIKGCPVFKVSIPKIIHTYFRYNFHAWIAPICPVKVDLKTNIINWKLKSVHNTYINLKWKLDTTKTKVTL